MKFLKSFKYAIEGFLHCVKSERNFRVHLVATVVVILLAVYFDLSVYEILTLTIAIALVLICEMLNTAIERTIDAIRELDERDNRPNGHLGNFPVADLATDSLDGLQQNYIDQLRKIGKDVAAGAVFVSSIFAMIVGVVIFLPKILEVLR